MKCGAPKKSWTRFQEPFKGIWATGQSPLRLDLDEGTFIDGRRPPRPWARHAVPLQSTQLVLVNP